jgi:hypothetical protein
MRPIPLALAAVLAFAPPALAQAPKDGAGVTRSLQGDPQGWAADPHMHAFYELTKTAFAAGPDKVDVDAYEAKSFAIFRAFGTAHGMKPEAMVDHLKLIPRQVVQIVREDPHVIDSYDNFVAATFGPP